MTATMTSPVTATETARIRNRELAAAETARRLDRQAALAQERRWKAFDEMVQADDFGQYLKARGWQLRDRHPEVPAAYDAEQAALGAMLTDGEACRTALSRLRPSHFHRDSHRAIFQAVAAVNQRACRGESISVDFVTVTEQLRADHTLEHFGAPYVASLLDACPGAASIESYCRDVLRAAKLRALWALGERLGVDALAPRADPEAIISGLRRVAETIELHSGFERRKPLEG